MIPVGWLLVVYALCVYRLTRLVTTDFIFDPFRDWVRARAFETMVRSNLAGDVVDSKVQPRSRLWVWLFNLITCDWCISFWLAAGCVLGWHFAASWFNYVALVFALSAFAGLVRERLA